METEVEKRNNEIAEIANNLTTEEIRRAVATYAAIKWQRLRNENQSFKAEKEELKIIIDKGIVK